MSITSPRQMELALQSNSYAGERLNALFMSWAMDDGDAMRIMVHRDFHYKQPIMQAFYDYYQDHDKTAMLKKIEEISEGGSISCPFDVSIIGGIDDYQNREGGTGHPRNIGLTDYNFYSEKESKWANLEAYDEKHSAEFYDDTGTRFSKKFEDITVAEVLKESVGHRAYHHYRQPCTGDKELDLLLKNIYYNKELHEPTYFQALKRLNQTMADSYSGRGKAIERNYVDAVIMTEDKAKFIFDNMDYRRQFGFYRSETGQELLKFTYLTAFGRIRKFDEKDMERFLNEVKKANMWQTAQNTITRKIVKNIRQVTPLTQRWFEMALIRPKPKERMYHGYYEDDLKRANYLNLYLDKQTR